MARLMYSAMTSLDGYIADTDGDFSWAEPDDQAHAYANDLMRPIGTHLYGRRLYEVMVWWETALDQPDVPPIERDFAELWQAADKVVYSRTLTAVSSARTRIEREFDPRAVRALRDSADRDLVVGGADLGSQALRAGLVDDLSVIVAPIVVGGGIPALPPGLRLGLDLQDERRFGNGMVALRYAVSSAVG